MTPNWCRKIRKIQTGQIKRMVNRKTGKRVPFRVPQLVNSSRTIFFGTYHPRNRQVMNELNGMSSWAVKLSQLLRKSLPKKPKSGTAP